MRLRGGGPRTLTRSHVKMRRERWTDFNAGRIKVTKGVVWYVQGRLVGTNSVGWIRPGAVVGINQG